MFLPLTGDEWNRCRSKASRERSSSAARTSTSGWPSRGKEEASLNSRVRSNGSTLEVESASVESSSTSTLGNSGAVVKDKAAAVSGTSSDMTAGELGGF